MSASYTGEIRNGRYCVTVNLRGRETPLNPRFDLRRHSPDGFAWGYGGSGPAQLALALICHALQSDDRAQRLYQDFKWHTVARWPQDGKWTITESEIAHICNILEDRRKEIAQ